MINVTKTYLPDFDTYASILKRAWDKEWITNNGELVQELEQKLKNYLDVAHLLFTNNGTIVLQMALKVLNITKEVITTPFSYVATTNAILWEGCNPIFVDIDPNTFCIDASKIEAAITPHTQAILATHVYGIPCDVETINSIAKKHRLKVIYDAAHAFGVEYKGRSLFSYGDISTCSFHATKLFHTVEGGCIIANDENLQHTLMLYRQFGHVGDEYFSEGINAKNSEFHAAMGLSILPDIEKIVAERGRIIAYYNERLKDTDISSPVSFMDSDIKWNNSYFPIVFESEQRLTTVKKSLEERKIFARRYFYPSLNQLPFLKTRASCPISENIAARVLSLPLYYGLTSKIQDQIIEVITNVRE